MPRISNPVILNRKNRNPRRTQYTNLHQVSINLRPVTNECLYIHYTHMYIAQEVSNRWNINLGEKWSKILKLYRVNARKHVIEIQSPMKEIVRYLL